MESMTITIESNRGTRMRFQVEHEPHFDLRSEEVDGLHSTVRTVESTLAESDDGRLCLVLAKLTLGSIIESLPPASTEPAVPVKTPARRWRKPAIALAILALAGAGGYAATRAGSAKPAPAAAEKKETVHELAPRDIARVEARPLALTLPLSGAA